MRIAIYVLGAIVLIGVGILTQRSQGSITTTTPRDAGVPIGELAQGRPVPQIGLTVPLASWIPLPQSGRAIAAGVALPQPPYGLASSVTLTIDESGEAFLAAYQRQLESAGFTVRRTPAAVALTDIADARMEATSQQDPHSVFVAVRARTFVQLTFWDGPVPRH